MFWQTIRRLCDKRSHGAKSINDQNGVFLSEEDILGRRDEFKNLSNPVTNTPLDMCHEVHLGEENPIIAEQVLLAVKTLKDGKATGYDEIQPEVLKALNRIPWLTHICQVAWCSGRAPNDWQTGVIIPIHKKADRTERTNYLRISLLSLHGRVAESEVFGWSRIPKNTRSRCRIF